MKVNYYTSDDTNIIIDHTQITRADENWLEVLRWEVLLTTVWRGVAQLAS